MREEGQVELWETPNGLDADSSLLRHLAFLWQYAELRTNVPGSCRVARLDRTTVVRLPQRGSVRWLASLGRLSLCKGEGEGEG